LFPGPTVLWETSARYNYKCTVFMYILPPVQIKKYPLDLHTLQNKMSTLYVHEYVSVGM
jgi:hypothetical protein